MRDRHQSDVLARFERDLRRDPVLRDLTARLARCAGRCRARRAAASAPTLLAGLTLMLLGAVTLSLPLAGAGVAAAVVALLAAVAPTAGRGPCS